MRFVLPVLSVLPVLPVVIIRSDLRDLLPYRPPAAVHHIPAYSCITASTIRM